MGGVGDFEKIPARQFWIKKIPALTSWGKKYPTQYFVEKMLQNCWWFAIEKTGAQFFLEFILTVCKLKPEILNIIKYALIVHLDNQWIFHTHVKISQLVASLQTSR